MSENREDQSATLGTSKPPSKKKKGETKKKTTEQKMKEIMPSTQDLWMFMAEFMQQSIDAVAHEPESELKTKHIEKYSMCRELVLTQVKSKK